MPTIQVGQCAPEIQAVNGDGEIIRLSDFRGKHSIVLYFYPRDGTPHCTTQACEFRDAYEDFQAAGAVVIGVSGDSVDRHRHFANDRRLPFILLSDSDGTIRKAFGVPKTFGIFPGRVTYVIDPQGIVQMVFNSQWQAKRHIDEALTVVRRLSSKSPA